MRSFLVFVLLCLSALGALGADISTLLAWEASTEPDVVLYRLKFGTASGDYTKTVDIQTIKAAGWVPEGAVVLPAGVIGYAVVVAVNSGGLESPPSDELAFQSNEKADQKAPSAPKGLRVKQQVKLSMQQSKNLKDWTTLYSQTFPTTGAFCFYRLQLEGF